MFVLFKRRNVVRSAVVEEEKKKKLKIEGGRETEERLNRNTSNSHSAVGSYILY